MIICVNSRNLDEIQQARIEGYFKDNFSFAGREMTVVWKEDDSEFILLSYRLRNQEEAGDEIVHDFRTMMCRVHENELMEIAGRQFVDVVTKTQQLRNG